LKLVADTVVKKALNTAPLRGIFDVHPLKRVHSAQANSVKAAGQWSLAARKVKPLGGDGSRI